MYYRIEVKDENRWIGAGRELAQAMSALRLEDPILPGGDVRFEFWFTQEGWEAIGEKLETLAKKWGIEYRVRQSEINSESIFFQCQHQAAKVESVKFDEKSLKRIRRLREIIMYPGEEDGRYNFAAIITE